MGDDEITNLGPLIQPLQQILLEAARRQEKRREEKRREEKRGEDSVRTRASLFLASLLPTYLHIPPRKAPRLSTELRAMSSNEFIEVKQSSPSNDEGDTDKNLAENLSNMTESFMKAMAKREEKLKEREVALEKAINGVDLEKQLMAGRMPGDILELDVGGTRIRVKRSTLCQCEDSLLAAHFSGRWDDNVDKVEEAFFINEPPELFIGLVDFLRLKEIEIPSWPAMLPEALRQSLNFRRLVDYYGVTSLVFSDTYVWEFPDFSKAERNKVYNSDPFYIGGCEWKLEIQPLKRYHYENYVALYLNALGTDLPREASVTLRICGSKRNVSKAVKRHYFRSGSWSKQSCYWEDFITTDEVSDANAGFLVNDTLTIEAMIEVHDDDDDD